MFYSDVTRKYNGFFIHKGKKKIFSLKMTTVGVNKKGLENCKEFVRCGVTFTQGTEFDFVLLIY